MQIEAVVDEAITIVVGSVAAFGASIDARILTAVLRLAVQIEIAKTAAGHRARANAASRDGVRQVAGQTAATVLRIILFIKTVVGLTVAVVIEVVANLRACIGRTNAKQHAKRAHRGASRTLAGIGSTGLAAPGIAIVNLPIAIVVEPIAALDAAVGRRALVFTAGHRGIHVVKAGIAGRNLAPASNTCRRGMQQRTDMAATATVIDVGLFIKSFVDRTFAIVVALITTLDAVIGRDAEVFAVCGVAIEIVVARLARPARAHRVLAKPLRVGVSTAIATLATIIGVGRKIETLVGLAIAIIIRAIAGFRLRQTARVWGCSIAGRLTVTQGIAIAGAAIIAVAIRVAARAT